MSSTAKNAAVKPVSLVWLRRDLRLHDHRTFAAAIGKGVTQAVFLFDADILARFTHTDDRRLTLIAQQLCNLHEALRREGGGLLVLHGRAVEAIPSLCRALCCDHLFAAQDYEPATRARDDLIRRALQGKTHFHCANDHLLLAPDELLKSDGGPYKVFTPYANAWQEKIRAEPGRLNEASLEGLRFADYSAVVQGLLEAHFRLIPPEEGPGAMLSALGYRPNEHDWPAGEAQARLRAFADKALDFYDTRRDFLGGGTSRLSPYLRFGLLSVRECARIAFEARARGSAGAATWLKELVWRDFYAMILFHFPDTQACEMKPQYRGLAWSRDKAVFERFAHGMTGFPVIDAAMRELLDTGYMHNRARMIAASFMTKDLQLDWRLGEEHFAQYLMDYELSSNVGGWQWAASTGTDAQPYFRIFNPALQGKKFDPQGKYIRRYVPELVNLESNAIHAPSDKTRPPGYPDPIVDHGVARKKVMAMFSNKGDV